jgi:hypothetical protein
MNELLITGPCCYPSTEPVKLLLASAAHNGLKVHIYGVGEPFIAHGADAQVVKLRRELETLRHLYRTVLVTDMADVLFLAGEREILYKYRRMNSPLVMSTERGYWPDEGLAAEFPEDPHGYRYINAGQYIGEMDHVITCLDWLLNKYRSYHPGMDNSQPWWHQAYVRKELEFALDRKCRLFQTMSGGADGHVAVYGSRLYNSATKTLPCTVHYNGPGNEKPYEEMYRRLYADTR